MANDSFSILLFRRDPARNIARFYDLAIEPSLFSENAVTRRWGRIGTRGRTLTEFHADEATARARFEQLSAAKRKRGYAPRDG